MPASTRATQARRYRDEALAELDAAGVVQPAARERLEQIIVVGDQRVRTPPRRAVRGLAPNA